MELQKEIHEGRIWLGYGMWSSEYTISDAIVKKLGVKLSVP